MVALRMTFRGPMQHVVRRRGKNMKHIHDEENQFNVWAGLIMEEEEEANTALQHEQAPLYL